MGNKFLRARIILEGPSAPEHLTVTLQKIITSIVRLGTRFARLTVEETCTARTTYPRAQQQCVAQIVLNAHLSAQGA